MGSKGDQDIMRQLFLHRSMEKLEGDKQTKTMPESIVQGDLEMLDSQEDGLLGNSQESTVTVDHNLALNDTDTKKGKEKAENQEIFSLDKQVDRRRSERLKKNLHMSTMEKNEAMAKKRSLEGLYPEMDKEQLEEGANLMLKVAKEILAAQTARQANLLLQDAEQADTEDED